MDFNHDNPVPEILPEMRINGEEIIVDFNARLITFKKFVSSTLKDKQPPSWYINWDLDSDLRVKTLFNEVGEIVHTEVERIRNHFPDVPSDYEDAVLKDGKQKARSCEQFQQKKELKKQREEAASVLFKEIPPPGGWPYEYNKIISNRIQRIQWKTYRLTIRKQKRTSKASVAMPQEILHWVITKQLQKKLNENQIDQLTDVLEIYRSKRNISSEMLPLLYSIAFYHPVRGHRWTEVQVLSFQTLADLRDSFKCSSDLNQIGGNFTGCCFLFDGLLYGDYRDKDSTDYVGCIMENLKYSSYSRIKQNSYLCLSEAILSQIPLVIHQKGGYLHQGDCQHRVVVTAVRLYSPKKDCPFMEGYPLKTYQFPQRRTNCKACLVRAASKVVFNCSWFPSNPTSLCNECTDTFFRDIPPLLLEDDLKVVDYKETEEE